MSTTTVNRQLVTTYYSTRNEQYDDRVFVLFDDDDDDDDNDNDDCDTEPVFSSSRSTGTTVSFWFHI